MQTQINILIGCGLLAVALGVKADELKNSFARTLQTHPAISRGLSEIDRQSAVEALASSGLKPQLEAIISRSWVEQEVSSSVARFDGSTNRVVASQSLIDAEARANLERETLLSKSVAVRLESVRMRLATQLVERYVNAVSARSRANAISDLVGNLEKRLIRAKQMYQKGRMSRLDLLRVENRLVERRSDLSSAKGDALIARAALSEIDPELGVTNIHSPTEVSIEWPQLSDRKNLLSAMYETNPEVLAIEKQIAAELKGLTAIDFRRFPKLVFSATYEESDIGSNNRQVGDATSTIFGLNLSMPIYRGGSLVAERTEKKSLVSQLEADLEVARRFLLRSLDESLTKYNNSKNVTVNEIENVRGQVLAVSVLTQAFDRGAISQTELLDAYDSLANAKISRDQVIFSGLLNWLELRILAGQFEPDDLTLIESVVAQYQS